MGRPPIGKHAMTDAERKRRLRQQARDKRDRELSANLWICNACARKLTKPELITLIAGLQQEITTIEQKNADLLSAFGELFHENTALRSEGKRVLDAYETSLTKFSAVLEALDQQAATKQQKPDV